MIQKLVKMEIERLKTQGYDCIVTSEILRIDRALHIENVGNNIWFLTGIIIGDSDLQENSRHVYLYSPISTLNFKQQRISELSTSILKKIKNFLIIKTRRENQQLDRDADIDPYYLEFIKISPVKITEETIKIQ